MDPARSGHHPVAEHLLVFHVEVAALVDHELVDLEERTRVEEELEPLAGGLLPGLVLAPTALLAATELGLSVAPTQLVEPVFERHQAPSFIDFRPIIHQ